MEATYEVDSGISAVDFIVTLRIYRLEPLDSKCHDFVRYSVPLTRRR